MAMRDEPLHLEVHPGSTPDAVVVRLQGPLTLHTLFPLQGTARAQTAPLLVLDMTEVPYIDSAGLGAVMMLHASAGNKGRRLALAGASERVMSLIRMTRVDAVLSLYPTVADAEQSQ
jgi:anti-anti-sigma factor